jgi:hypothetical protein
MRFLLSLIFAASLFVGSLAYAEVTFTTNTLIAWDNTDFDGEAIFVVGCTLTVDRIHYFEALHLSDGAVLTHSPEFLEGCFINIAASLHVDASSAINVNERGYPAAEGPGAGASCNWNASGAGHGGEGGRSEFCLLVGMCYDDVSYPTLPGSGGGTRLNGDVLGGKGGGVMRIAAQEIIAAGPITANGGPSVEGGGGSGGTIFLSAPIMQFSRTVSALGGNALSGGGGGGGRILLLSESTGLQIDYDSLLACGGTTLGQHGGAGVVTVSFSDSDEEVMFVRNCGNVGAVTVLSGELPGIVVGNGARLFPPSELFLEETLLIEDLGGIVTVPLVPIRINARNISIQDFGFISADKCGFPANQGPGAGVSAVWEAGGAGHGGIGCCPDLGGSNYGNLFDPSSEFGSGGGSATRYTGNGGEGGGAIRLVARETFFHQGVISANAGIANARGGGSGGGITVYTPLLTGDGVIMAIGSYSTFAGGVGAGGRIAMGVCDFLLDSALVQVNPGDLNHLPGYGTIYWGDGDMNHNGTHDGCDFATGISTDGNQNGIPDELEVEGNATELTIEHDAQMQRTLLRWPLLPAYSHYQIWGSVLGGPPVLIATETLGIFDLGPWLQIANPDDVWSFQVVGVP